MASRPAVKSSRPTYGQYVHRAVAGPLRLRAKAALALMAFLLFTGLAGLAAGGYRQASVVSPVVVAVAGANGQQLDFSDGIGYVNSVAVSGYNQYGQYATNSWSTPYFDDNYLSGWFWIGYITMDEYGASSNYLGEEWTTVPKSQGSNWWWYCDFQGGSSSSTGGTC
jgi:hypothetical protein